MSMERKWLKRLTWAGATLPILFGAGFTSDSSKYPGSGSAAAGLFVLAGLCMVALAILAATDQRPPATDAASAAGRKDECDVDD